MLSVKLKGSSPATATADFRISGKLIWAPPRHHRILKLVHIYHNNGWGKILSQSWAILQRFKIALPNCGQLGISWVSVGNWSPTDTNWYQCDPQVIPTDTKVTPNWYQLIPNWYQLIPNWSPTDTNWYPNWSPKFVILGGANFWGRKCRISWEIIRNHYI